MKTKATDYMESKSKLKEFLCYMKIIIGILQICAMTCNLGSNSEMWISLETKRYYF